MKATAQPRPATATPGPWSFEVGDAGRRSQSRIFKADDPDYPIGYAICEWAQLEQRAQDIANARLMAAAPALAFAWSLVPPEIRGRIFDALHKPATEWVAAAIEGLTE